MNIQKLRTLPTIKLISYLCAGEQTSDWNQIAYELTCRMYVPFNNEGISFDELLLKNGYIIENTKQQTKIK